MLLSKNLDLFLSHFQHAIVSNIETRFNALNSAEVLRRPTGSFDESTNIWPKKCEHCWLDDVDNPTSPYLLGRRIDRPVEFDIADIRNFFVKDREPSFKTSSFCGGYRANRRIASRLTVH